MQYERELASSELRIGNWVMDATAREWQVREIGNSLVNVYNDNESGEITPFGIPLTGDWLIKFGLEKIEHSNYNEWADESFFIMDERGAGKWHHYSSPGTFYLQYVHQLQNLYFALTGIELTLKAGS